MKKLLYLLLSLVLLSCSKNDDEKQDAVPDNVLRLEIHVDVDSTGCSVGYHWNSDYYRVSSFESLRKGDVRTVDIVRSAKTGVVWQVGYSGRSKGKNDETGQKIIVHLD